MTDWHVESDHPLTLLDAVAAIITVGMDSYLLQLRDNIPQIFYPGHWGLFGGAVESGESEEAALRRELQEELDLTVQDLRYFGRHDFEVRALKGGPKTRAFFEVSIEADMVSRLTLGEGSAFRVFSGRDLMTLPRLVPYDAFALWQHRNLERLR